MYDKVRLIDPITKKVINYENKTFVKIEYTPNKIYMVIAVPIELSNRKIIIELLMDTTDSMVYKDGNESNSDICVMIDSINKLSLKDALTGIYNRRYINEKLPVNFIKAALLNESLSIIIVDIDYFKEINDTYGHLTGDLTLKSFADILLACIKRSGDWISRYGGDEFLVCLPGVELKQAIDIAEYMRRTVENNVILRGEHTIKITASFGVYSIKPTTDGNVEDFIDCADKNLYLAKNNGKNRVEA